MTPDEDANYIEQNNEQQTQPSTSDRNAHDSTGTLDLIDCEVCGYRGKGTKFEMHMDKHNDEADAFDFTPLFSMVSEWTKMNKSSGGTKDKCIQTYLCNKCPYRSFCRIRMRHHLEYCAEDRPCFGCVVCGKAFKEKKRLRKHFRANHTEVNDDTQEQPENDESSTNKMSRTKKSFACNRCSFKSKSEESFRQHREVCGKPKSNKWECKECGNRLKERRYLLAHLRQHRMSHLKCPKCGMPTSVKDRQQHIAGCCGFEKGIGISVYDKSVARVLKEASSGKNMSNEDTGKEIAPDQEDSQPLASCNKEHTSADKEQDAKKKVLTCQVCKHQGHGLAFQLHMIDHNNEENHRKLDKHYRTVSEQVKVEALDGVMVNENVNMYVCLYCPYKSDSQTSISGHVESCIINRPLFGCHICGNALRKKRYVLSHFRKFHNDAPDERAHRPRKRKRDSGQSQTGELNDEGENRINSTKRSLCVCVCQFSTDSAELFNYHSKTCSNYIAHQLEKASKEIECLDANMDLQRADPLKCPKCGEITEEKDHDWHVASCKGDLYCHICDRYFRKQGNYRKHMLSHKRADATGNTGNLQSKSCATDSNNIEKDAVDVENYQSKWKAFEQKEPIASKDGFVCERCSYKCKIRYQMLAHQQSCGVVEHKHPCPFCGKLFKTEKTLYTHVHAHETGTLYQCSKCGCQFVGKKLFDEHWGRCRGTGTWYTCNVCTRTFNTLKNYKIHIDRHKKGTFKPRHTPIFRRNKSKATNDDDDDDDDGGGYTEVAAGKTAVTSTYTNTEAVNFINEPPNLNIEIPNINSEIAARANHEVTIANAEINAVTNANTLLVESDIATVAGTGFGVDANQGIAVDLAFSRFFQ